MGSATVAVTAFEKTHGKVFVTRHGQDQDRLCGEGFPDSQFRRDAFVTIMPFAR